MTQFKVYNRDFSRLGQTVIFPIAIEDGCLIGGGVIIVPGVTV
jgi:acetyltransferase-like isoleucine patch superfamily enzyme